MNKPGGAVDSIGSYFEEEKEPIIFDDQGLEIALKHAGVTEEQTDDYLVIGNYYFEYEAGIYNVILTINEMNHSYLMDSLRKYLKIEVFPADWIL